MFGLSMQAMSNSVNPYCFSLLQIVVGTLTLAPNELLKGLCHDQVIFYYRDAAGACCASGRPSAVASTRAARLGVHPLHQLPGAAQLPVVFVSVAADGLNVRVAPDGPPAMALVNGTPLYVLDRQGSWSLVAPACDLVPTWAWSWTAGVPLNRCFVWYP
jgi:hypothetical protein